MRECRRSPQRTRPSRAAARTPRTVPPSWRPRSAAQTPRRRAETPQRSSCDGHFPREPRLVAVSQVTTTGWSRKTSCPKSSVAQVATHRGDPDAIELRNMNERQTKMAEHIGPLTSASPFCSGVSVSDVEAVTSCRAELTPADPQGGVNALCHGPSQDAVGRLSRCLKIAPYRARVPQVSRGAECAF